MCPDLNSSEFHRHYDFFDTVLSAVDVDPEMKGLALSPDAAKQATCFDLVRPGRVLYLDNSYLACMFVISSRE